MRFLLAILALVSIDTISGNGGFHSDAAEAV